MNGSLRGHLHRAVKCAWFMSLVWLLSSPFTACGSPAILIEAHAWMTTFAFSATGDTLFLRYYFRAPDPSNPGYAYSLDRTIEAFETGSWKRRSKVVSAGVIKGGPYTCGTNDVAFFNDGFEQGQLQDLKRWDLSSGATRTLFSVDRAAYEPFHPGDWSTLHCDPAKGLLYLGVIDGEVTVIDQTTGAVVRRYPTGRPANLPFRVNERARRLYVCDWDNYQLLSFDLDTAEPLGEITYWTFGGDSRLPRDMVESGDSRVLLWLVGTSPDVGGLFFFVINLESMTIESQAVLEGFNVGDHWSTCSSENILLAIHRAADNWLFHLALIDFINGEIVGEIDMSWHHQGQVLPLPQIGRIYIDDWRAAGGPAARVYSFPELELLHQGRAPNPSDEKRYVSDGQFIVMTSAFNEHFGVFDPVNNRVLDDFWACTRLGDVAYGALAVDPTERWAAMICAGTEPDEIDSIDDVPRGAGVAVVDLDRYR